MGLEVFRFEGLCDPFEGFSEPSCGLGFLDFIQVDGSSAFTDEFLVTLHPFHRLLGPLSAIRARDGDFNLVNHALHLPNVTPGRPGCHEKTSVPLASLKGPWLPNCEAGYTLFDGL